MSRTWDLELPTTEVQGCPRLHLAETHDHLSVEVEQVNAWSVSFEMDDRAGRAIRDWLSWYLDEGPEPGA